MCHHEAVAPTLGRSGPVLHMDSTIKLTPLEEVWVIQSRICEHEKNVSITLCHVASWAGKKLHPTLQPINTQGRWEVLPWGQKSRGVVAASQFPHLGKWSLILVWATSRAVPEGIDVGEQALRIWKQNWTCLLLIAGRGELIRAVHCSPKDRLNLPRLST